MALVEGVFARTTDAAEKAFGRKAPVAGMFMLHEMQWVPGTGSAGATAGVALDMNGVTVRVRVSPVFQAGKLSAMAFLSQANVASATTYKVTVDGTDYTTTSKTTPQAVVEALAAAVNAAATANEDTRATALPWGAKNGFAEGTYALWVWNQGDYDAFPDAVTPPALNVVFATSGGTGAWTARYQDAESIDFDVYELHDDAPGEVWSEPWGVFPGGSVEGQTRPWTQKFNMAGSKRVAVHVTAVTELPDVGSGTVTTAWAWVSPAISEEA
jgi:hypothetical protein